MNTPIRYKIFCHDILYLARRLCVECARTQNSGCEWYALREFRPSSLTAAAGFRMAEFEFLAKIANAPAAAPVIVIRGLHTPDISLLVFTFYTRNQLDLVNLVMAVTGAYCGLVDSYVVWKECKLSKAVTRLISSGLFAAWGFG